MTSALIVVGDALYELECTDGYQVMGFGDQGIAVRDEAGHTIGVIMTGDPHTLWLHDLSSISGSCIPLYLEKGTLYSDDHERDGINVVLEHVMVGT